MSKATVNRKILDTLIRAKVATLTNCKGVRPLPVAWQAQDEAGRNWLVSGWTGESGAVRRCVEQMHAYLRLLSTHFQIPSEAG